MKVLVVGTGGALRGSGISTMADQMTRTLTAMGHEPVRLVAGDRRRTRPNRLNAENVTAVLTDAVRIARRIRSTHADVVWLHTFGVPTLPAIRALAEVLAARAVGCPTIVQFHAFDLEGHLERPGVAQRLALKLLGRMSAGLVALDERGAQALGRFGPVSVLPNWVEVPAQPPPMPSGPPYVAVFVGGLTRRKGIIELVQALRLSEDLPVRLCVVGGVGDDGPEVAASVRRRASDLVATGRVEFLGDVDSDGVRQALHSAHFLVLPSRAEGIPMAMLEAFAAGRPTLVGSSGSMGAIVRDQSCGETLEATDPKEISEGLRRMVQDPARLADLGRRAHAVALRQFSQRSVEEELTRLLERAARGARATT